MQASCRVEVAGNCWAGEFARAPSKKAGAHSDEKSITIKRVHRGRVAQLGEHLLCKQGVTGSIPVTSTKAIDHEAPLPQHLCAQLPQVTSVEA